MPERVAGPTQPSAPTNAFEYLTNRQQQASGCDQRTYAILMRYRWGADHHPTGRKTRFATCLLTLFIACALDATPAQHSAVLVRVTDAEEANVDYYRHKKHYRSDQRVKEHQGVKQKRRRLQTIRAGSEPEHRLVRISGPADALTVSGTIVFEGIFCPSVFVLET